MSSSEKQIIEYIRYPRGDKAYLIGCLVAFRRSENQRNFYLGWSLKHKEDWAFYDEYDFLVGSEPFNKELAIKIAKDRAMKWAMCPEESRDIPHSVRTQAAKFIRRAKQYFKVDYKDMPPWIPVSITTDMRIEDEEFEEASKER